MLMNVHEYPYKSPEAEGEGKRWKVASLWWSGPFLVIASVGSYAALISAAWDAELASQFQTQEEAIAELLKQPVLGNILFCLTWLFIFGVLICAAWCVRNLLKAGLGYARRRAVFSR